MNTLQNTSTGEQTFIQFLGHNRRNRMILYLAAAVIIIEFGIFKYLYPFANYAYEDSFVYLKGAYENLTINTYPIGYSKFLRLVSVFAKPDLVLVSLQYGMIQCSMLFLLFTIFYFYKMGNVMQGVLLCIMVTNPLLLHLANMITSDGVFLALSMTWFALLLWIIYNPTNIIIFWHAIVLFAAFTVRYNALIYPIIALVAFGLSKLSLRKKIMGLGLALLLIGWFVGLSMFQYKKLTGYWQFSPFGGWLLANNAMYAYREIDPADREPVPLQFRALDNMMRNFHDMYPHLQLGWDGYAYMWNPNFPLLQYRDSLFKKDVTATEFKKWASMGPLYSSYGWYIIKKYPAHFIRYFVWPNSGRYFGPPIEFLGGYNSGKPTVPEPAVKWFGYTSNRVKVRMKTGQVLILLDYPFYISIINIIMFLMMLSYLLLKGWQYNPAFNKTILLAGIVWLANAGFTILTCFAALRFQSFSVLIGALFSLLLIDWLAQLIQRMKVESQQQETTNEYSHL